MVTYQLLRSDADGPFVVIAQGSQQTMEALLRMALPSPDDYEVLEGMFFCGGDVDGGKVAPYTIYVAPLVEDHQDE